MSQQRPIMWFTRGQGQQPMEFGVFAEVRQEPVYSYYDQTQASGWGDVGPLPQDTAKMVIETLCVAQSAIGQVGDDRKMEHIERLQRLIDQFEAE